MADRKKTVITITTASKLTAAQLKQVKDLITAKVGPAEFEQVVDPAAIGGIKLSIGSQDFDATISGKLEKLESQLPEAVVTTAVPLSAAQRKELLAGIEKKHGSVQLIEKVDPAVLGGVRLVVGSTEVDATIHGKVMRLKEQLMSSM